MPKALWGFLSVLVISASPALAHAGTSSPPPGFQPNNPTWLQEWDQWIDQFGDQVETWADDLLGITDIDSGGNTGGSGGGGRAGLMTDDFSFPARIELGTGGPKTPILQRFRERARSIWESVAQPTFSPARRDRNGFWSHKVRSPYQAGSTRIRVLLPQAVNSHEPHPVVYVLPVEARDGSDYGDGLREVQKQDLHNRYRAIFVAPTFSHPPWYADHPTHPVMRQESYLLEVVVPFIERTYPAIARPEGRRLLGFSKSGWGAWTLLLRHPEVFDRAASWDAPVMMNWPSPFDSAEIFGTRENFEHYHLQRLLQEKCPALGPQCRLWLGGHRIFRSHQHEIHALLQRLQIRHEYRDGPDRPHDWHSGWVSESVAWLLGP